eukprot:SAG11_NODE_890_length_6689_cov_18.947951_8_plen_80_part_00
MDEALTFSYGVKTLPAMLATCEPHMPHAAWHGRTLPQRSFSSPGPHPRHFVAVRNTFYVLQTGSSARVAPMSLICAEDR